RTGHAGRPTRRGGTTGPMGRGIPGLSAYLRPRPVRQPTRVPATGTLAGGQHVTGSTTYVDHSPPVRFRHPSGNPDTGGSDARKRPHPGREGTAGFRAAHNGRHATGSVPGGHRGVFVAAEPREQEIARRSPALWHGRDRRIRVPGTRVPRLRLRSRSIRTPYAVRVVGRARRTFTDRRVSPSPGWNPPAWCNGPRGAATGSPTCRPSRDSSNSL